MSIKKMKLFLFRCHEGEPSNSKMKLYDVLKGRQDELRPIRCAPFVQRNFVYFHYSGLFSVYFLQAKAKY